MTRVAVEGLSKTFGDVKAVIDLNLTVEEGECLCLLGPSGCGKTTTLHCLAGLEAPTAGAIRFGGVVVNHLPPRARNVGLVFQGYALFLHMSVYENIAFGLKVRKGSRRGVQAEVGRMADLLRLTHLLNVKARRLSLSDMQRVALARTLITKPALLILDEPLSNLETTIRDTMRAELKRLQQDLRQTVVYVTHDQLEAMSLADHIAVMDLGVLQQVGTPEEIYHHPANLFVAGFIGNPPMNFMNGSLQIGERGPVFEHPAFRLPLPRHASVARDLTSPKAVLGVRPEEIELSGEGKGEGEIPGRVVLSERLGRRTLVTVRVGEDTLRVEAPQSVDPPIGRNIGLRLRPGGARVFDAETGTALGPSGGGS